MTKADSKTTTYAGFPNVGYDSEGKEILITLPQTHMLVVKPKIIERVVVLGVGVFTKTEEWNEVSGI